MNNAQKISEYLQIAKRIEAMENALSMKESEFRNQFNNSYERLKRDLNGYLGKIKPTVETVCSIYKTKATLSNGRIALCDGIYKAEYTPLNACEVAVRLGNESIKLLAMIVGKNNVDANLREFAKRYNAIVEIYSNIDSLKANAVRLSMSALQNEISQWKAKKQSVCGSESEFNSLVNQVIANSNNVINKAIINDKLTLRSDFGGDINIPLACEVIDGSMLGKGGKIFLSSLDWSLKKDGFIVFRKEREKRRKAKAFQQNLFTLHSSLFTLHSIK